MNRKLAFLLFVLGVPILSGCTECSEPAPSQEMSHSTATVDRSSPSNVDKLTSPNLNELVVAPDSITYHCNGKIYDASDKMDIIYQETIASFDEVMEEYTIANDKGEETNKAIATGAVLEFKYKRNVDICWMPFKERRSEFAVDSEGEEYYENELKDYKMEFTYNRLIFVIDGAETTVEGMLFIGSSNHAIGKIRPTERLMATLNGVS